MDGRITWATVAAAERLDMPPERLADILDVYLEECAKQAKVRKADREALLREEGLIS